MRISDWSSDVCSSDLISFLRAQTGGTQLCDLSFAGPPSANCNAGGGGGMNARAYLLAEATKRILLTDGAFGTEIQSYRLDEAAYAGALGLAKDQKGNNDILARSEEHTSELQSLMRISYAVFCLKKKTYNK